MATSYMAGPRNAADGQQLPKAVKNEKHLLWKLSWWPMCNQELLMFHWYYSAAVPEFCDADKLDKKLRYSCWKSLSTNKNKKKKKC